MVLGILLLLVLLCRTRVGIQAAYKGGILELKVRLGWLRLTLLPARKRKKRRPRQAEKEAVSAAKPKRKRAERPLPPIGWTDIREAASALGPPLRRALRRTRRGIRIDPLRLSLVLGGLEDPPAAAELYGRLQALVWTGMPAAQRLLDLPDPWIHMEADFTASAPRAEGELGLSARIGTLLAIALGVGIPAARWLLRFLKKGPRADAAAKAAQPN